MHETVSDALLQEVSEKVSQCDRCGACLPVCPLFSVKDVEASSARGKNAIARALAEGGVEPAPAVLARVDFCLLCRACVEACPNKVETDEAMIRVRQYLVNRIGAGRERHRATYEVLKHRGLVTLAAGACSLLRRLGVNTLLPRGILPDEFTRDQYLAAFAGPAALGAPPPLAGTIVAASANVAYFYGCGMRMLFPGAAAETRAILGSTTRLIKKDNVCCGLPHLAHGRYGDFLMLARKNIGLYEDAEIIVSDCASCSGMLKRVASCLADDPVWKDRAAAFSSKVMDLTEYLVARNYVPRKKVNALFTYHDPCHLARGQGIRRQPRDLLSATGSFVEMEGAELCCGGAGSFHLDYPEISAAILERKRTNIGKTGAAIVVTGCPGCLIQMNKAARESGNKFKAVHISQVL